MQPVSRVSFVGRLPLPAELPKAQSTVFFAPLSRSCAAVIASSDNNGFPTARDPDMAGELAGVVRRL